MCVGAQMEQTEAQLLSLVSGIAATVRELSAAAGIEPHATPNGKLSVDLDALGGGSARTPSGPLPPLPHVPQVPANADADSPGDSPGFEPQGGAGATPVAMVAAAGAKAEERTARMRKKSAEQEGAAADEQP